LLGKASSKASTAPAQSAGRVTSCRPGTTPRYRSCSWTHYSESATPSFSNSPRSVYGWTSRPTPDSWCSAVSNSKRPRRKEVAQPPGTCGAPPGGCAVPALEGGGGQSGVAPRR
jgi:hypothetical protein